MTSSWFLLGFKPGDPEPVFGASGSVKASLAVFQWVTSRAAATRDAEAMARRKDLVRVEVQERDAMTGALLSRETFKGGNA